MATHSSVLAWKIPRTEEPSELQSMGAGEGGCAQRVGHDRACTRHNEPSKGTAILLKKGFQGRLSQDTLDGQRPLSPAPLHKRWVRMGAYMGSRLLDKGGQSTMTFPRPSSWDWVRISGREEERLAVGLSFPRDHVRESSQATLLWGPAVMCTVWIWGEEPSPHFMEIPVDPVL